MKKILIVNNNMQTGGIQRSLVNFVNELCNDYDITLLLFADYGSLINSVDKRVKIKYSSKSFSVLGFPKEYLKKHLLLYVFKALAKTVNMILGKRSAIKLMGVFQKKIHGYDVAISYSHCTDSRKLSICTPEFVLGYVEAKTKICYIHCDYSKSGTYSEYNNKIYNLFDGIACCSNGVRDNFLSLNPNAKGKCYVVRNFYSHDVISLSNMNVVAYDDNMINIVICARLSFEKGIDRAMKALAESGRNDIVYYIVGDGPEKNSLEILAHNLNIDKRVIFVGEQTNPYRYIRKADYLLVPSLNEAAPMVYDEANLLNVRVITTETLSSHEMLGCDDYICENSINGLLSAIQNISKPNGPKCSDLFENQATQFSYMINHLSMGEQK